MRPTTRSRAGFSLIEMLTVIAIIGILTFMVAPRIDRALNQRDVQAARTGLANLYLKARVAAVTARRPATLHIDDSVAYVKLTTASGTQQVSEMLSLSGSGVTPSPTTASLTIQPTGLTASGTAFSIQLSKGGIYDTLTISGYGRVE